ncbi:MAG TPA: CpXC domain-containing protein, partial [Pirellulaceae bacterium]|nr:CpXC domain-containing protein [Pirellulaceae bacterium]
MSSNSPNADHSFSIEQTVECPGCRQSFESSPWLIVDADARRDLVERIVAGRLHEVTCPKCAR